MSLGLGIFLASIILAMTLLYVVTNNRWNWKTGVYRAAIFFAGLVALIALLGVSYFLYEALASRPKLQTTYADLKIGMSMSEVLYVKGRANSVEVLDNDSKYKDLYAVTQVKDLNSTQKIQDFLVWGYNQDDRNRVTVFFDKRSKLINEIQCYSPGSFYCPPLLGISAGDNEDQVRRKLGAPSLEKIDGTVKTMTYQTLKVRFWLEQKKVYMIAVLGSK